MLFYASLGNHDNQNNRFYKPFNMGGERYYTYAKKNVRFFALDSNHMDPQQLPGSTTRSSTRSDDWKICYFHHPLYFGGGRHGSEVDLRVALEPLFVKYGVNVVFSGHDHIYERIKPQKGITISCRERRASCERGPSPFGVDGGGLRSGSEFHAGGSGGRRDDVPSHLACRPIGRFRNHPTPVPTGRGGGHAQPLTSSGCGPDCSAACGRAVLSSLRAITDDRRLTFVQTLVVHDGLAGRFDMGESQDPPPGVMADFTTIA